MPNPYILLAVLLLVTTGSTGGYFFGRHVKAGEVETRHAQELRQAIVLAEDAAKHANELAATDYAEAARAFEAAQTRQTRSVASAYRVEHSVVTKVEYRNCTLDAEDLENLNQALGGY